MFLVSSGNCFSSKEIGEKYSTEIHNDICILKTKKVIITEFTNITWDLAKLEGENNSLEGWRKVHKDYFNKIDSTFNDDTKIIFEIFEVVERCK